MGSISDNRANDLYGNIYLYIEKAILMRCVMMEHITYHTLSILHDPQLAPPLSPTLDISTPTKMKLEINLHPHHFGQS